MPESNWNIKDMVKDGKKVSFQFYRSNELWYVTEDGFEFPVPIDECGDAVFLKEDKALLFMRYIRKHLNWLDAARKDQYDEFMAMLDRGDHLNTDILPLP